MNRNLLISVSKAASVVAALVVLGTGTARATTNDYDSTIAADQVLHGLTPAALLTSEVVDVPPCLTRTRWKSADDRWKMVGNGEDSSASFDA